MYMCVLVCRCIRTNLLQE